VGAIGTPGLGAGGSVLAPLAGGTGAAVEVPAKEVAPGLKGVGKTDGFFCSSGLPPSLPSDDDNLTNHPIAIAGCTLR